MEDKGHPDEQSQLSEAGESLILRLCREFPQFEPEWTEYLNSWDGDSPGSFLDISAFARFIDEEIFVRGNLEEARRGFALLDSLFLQGNPPTRDLIGIGFIEDLGNISSGRIGGHATITPLLPPTLHEVWNEIDRQWAGKNSLAEVVEAETAGVADGSAESSSMFCPWEKLLPSMRRS